MLTPEMIASDNDWAPARTQFPILDQEVFKNPLAYLDNAATTQMPLRVLDTIRHHYLEQNANVHRATHELSGRSTNAFEAARDTVARFIGAKSSNTIIFTRGTTDSLNMLAQMFEQKWGASFSVLVSMLEHHSNFVPWQQAARRAGGTFATIPLDAQGDIDLEAYVKLLDESPVGIVSVAHVSNVLGTVNPLAQIIGMAHQRGWLVSVDAAQSIRHEHVDVAALDCDFLSFSGHKTLGPTGIGVLYGKEELLNELPPVAFGGEMVDTVRTSDTTFESAPLRFEAGTPNYVGAIGLAAALDYLELLGRDVVAEREYALFDYAEQCLEEVPGVQILGTPQKRAGVLSFSVEGVHPFDIATLMDKMGIAIRAGNQCAQPLLNEVYSLSSVARISPAFYNTFEEIDRAIDALERALSICRSAL
ncbi:MAG: cysteine desulfurase [Eggerthellaceae bacterium]|nr:cysteine desulfurase [Eggerthellaceae bacterium]